MICLPSSLGLYNLKSPTSNIPKIKFLCHFDSIPFVDEKGHTINNSGSTLATLPGQYKFSPGSVFFNSVGPNKIFIPSSTDFGLGLPSSILGAADFCIDGWVYAGITATNMRIFHLYNTTVARGIQFYVPSMSSSTLKTIFAVDINGSVITSASITNNQFIHFLISRSWNGSTSSPVRFWINGTYVGSVESYNTDFGSSAFITLGAQSTNGTTFTNYFYGHLDELRIDVGSNRGFNTNSNFTPPTTPYTISSP